MKQLSGRVLLFVLAGSTAGLLTWLFSDVSQLIHLSDNVHKLTSHEATEQTLVGMAFGAFIGIMLGTADGLASGTKVEWWKVLLIGAIVGMVAGILGLTMGMQIFGLLYIERTGNPLAFVVNVLARAVGWGLIGAFAGTADGWRKLNLRVGRNGAIGGLIGGILGGTVFEMVPYLLVGFTRPGIVSRLLGFVITGAMIGLFVALVQQLLREAWIEVVLGRNEGKEYLVEKSETRIGRGELCEVPLFGNPQIAKVQAVVLAQPNNRFVLHEASGQPSGNIQVNDQPLSGERQLQDGDRIRIADRLLVFHIRATKKYTASAPKDVARSRPIAQSNPLPSLGDALPPVSPLGNSVPINNSYGNRSATATVSAGTARLVAISGPYTGSIFAVEPTGAIIGRDQNVGVPIPNDGKASRNHARIGMSPTGFVIEDTGSTNGTFVNGQKISRQSLLNGDTVVIGTTSFRFEA